MWNFRKEKGRGGVVCLLLWVKPSPPNKILDKLDPKGNFTATQSPRWEGLLPTQIHHFGRIFLLTWQTRSLVITPTWLQPHVFRVISREQCCNVSVCVLTARHPHWILDLLCARRASLCGKTGGKCCWSGYVAMSSLTQTRNPDTIIILSTWKLC